jgi:predicted ATP-dependent endonuclease of OLD family
MKSDREVEHCVFGAEAASQHFISVLDQFIPQLHRIGPEEWHDSLSGQTITFEDAVQIYADQLPDDFRTLDAPPWLRRIQECNPIHLIETQRLLDIRHAKSLHGRRRVSEHVVRKCAEDLAERIKSKLAESAALSQTLERSFPARLVSEAGPEPMLEPRIREELRKIENERSRLVVAGLIDRANEDPLPRKNFDPTTRKVLTAYVQDTQRKFALFEDFLKRIEVMKSIVDSRFLYKAMSIDREQGFVFRTTEGRQLALTDLSSGEQHELVLLYEFLFRTKENTLILIDEPELSLHIAWQQKFLRDLIEIARLAKLRALVATHSPQIIHDRWDLTVELEGQPA